MIKLKIDEIFKSIQGEGFNFGKEFLFVRFTGCNYDCSWCDQPTKTNYEMTEEELITEIRKYDVNSVLFTGGEPTLQLTESLVKKLKDQGYYIAIETNGSNKLPNGIDYITVSPKIGFGKDVVIDRASEVRFPADSLEVERYLEMKKKIKAQRYFLSPVYIEKEGRFDFEKLAIVYDKLREHDFRISIQLHKLMGVR